MKTVLITGCSSGFGLEIARYFGDRGWKVIATMRRPDETILPSSETLKVLPLDVTDAESIRACIKEAGEIDALVNNAGIGWMNALEGTPMDTVRDIFETNTVGTMAMTQAVIPRFRERRSGVIVNVSSSVTLKPLPLLSVYTASKAAVNAFTQVLALELKEFDVRVRLVLPGRAPETGFSESARSKLQGQGGFPDPYSKLVGEIFANRDQQQAADMTYSIDVCEAVWRAVTDPASPIEIPAGADAKALAA